jgi:hypothetical protein
MNPTVERFFTAQAETSSGAGCGSRAIGGGVIVGQSGRAPRLHLGANTIFARTCSVLLAAASAGSRSDHSIAAKQPL